MFVILFGLSMDYEVFLLSGCGRSSCGPGTASPRSPRLAATARVITSAALIMAAVFRGFVLDRAS